MKKNARIAVKGQFESSSFNFYSMWIAAKLDITASIDFFLDDTIYLEALGEEKKLNEFIDWCRKGPEGSKIKNVDVELRDLSSRHRAASRLIQNYREKRRALLEKVAFFLY